MIYLCLNCRIVSDKPIENHKLLCKKDKGVESFNNVQELGDYYEKKIYRAEHAEAHELALREQSERILSDAIKDIVKTAKRKKRGIADYLKRVN